MSKSPKQVVHSVRSRKRVTFLAIWMLAAILGVAGLVLRGVKESALPFWLAETRMPIVALIIMLMIALVALSPVIAEANSNPRPLSGPGRLPPPYRVNDEDK